MEKYVIYLDILGFTNIVEASLEIAAVMLSDVNEIFRIQSKDGTQYNTTDTEYSTSAFDEFIVMSDSIIVSSKIPCLMLMQISEFMGRCLDLSVATYSNNNYSYTNMNPVTTELKDINGNTTLVPNLPILFRGSGAWGDIYSPKVFGKVSGNSVGTYNIIGNGFVQAYKSERSGFKGPRLVLSKEFYENLKCDKLKHLFIQQKPDTYEFLWFYTIYCEMNGAECEIKKINRYLVYAIDLRDYYNAKNKKLVVHYNELICLIVHSTLAHFKHIWSNEGLKTAKCSIKSLIKEKNKNILRLHCLKHIMSKFDCDN
jgi:hypothetical protein